MDTSFSHALRVVICPGCGAALHASVTRCELTCDVCDTVFELAPRVEREAPTAIEESERLARLGEQDPAPLTPPPEVKALASDGELPDHRADEAMQLWQETRRDLEADGGDDGEALARRFYFLTRMLYERLVRQEDALQLRAILETALEVVGHPRYRQTFRCMLACEAARVGDLTGAQDWLEPCDPRAADIHADSVYRYTVAYVATHKRQWAEVIDAVGATHRDVPLAASFDAICTVLRANAHEKRQDLPAAVYELSEGMRRLPGGVSQVEGILRNSGTLTLCRRSYGKARELVEGGAPAPRPGLSPLSILPWTVLSLVFFGLAVGVEGDASGSRLDLVFLALGALFVVPIIIVFLRAQRGRS